ncbi:MAG TPA: hypothetical protein VGR18_15030, partial [Rubrobacter sp.]|nr:hypothetical protein [Rubrobacter sp.]
MALTTRRSPLSDRVRAACATTSASDAAGSSPAEIRRRRSSRTERTAAVAAASYSNLEYDLEAGRRGSRY